MKVEYMRDGEIAVITAHPGPQYVGRLIQRVEGQVFYLGMPLNYAYNTWNPEVIVRLLAPGECFQVE